MPRHLHTSSVIRKHPKALARKVWAPGKKCGKPFGKPKWKRALTVEQAAKMARAKPRERTKAFFSLADRQKGVTT